MNPLNRSVWLIPVFAAVIYTLQTACTPLPPQEVKQPNRAPVIENTIYAKDAMAGSEVQIECLARDADSDNLSYQWRAEAGQLREYGPSAIWMPPGKMGTYPITLTVTDGKGGLVTENISIRVLTNEDGTATPFIELQLKSGAAEPVIKDEQRARIWTTTDILCIVENAGGGDLTYTWTATDGKLQGKDLEIGKASRIRWIAPGVKSDVTISVTVVDSQGKEAKGQVNISVFCCGN